MNFTTQNEKKKWPKGLLWTSWIVCILIIIALTYCIFIYNDIQRSKTKGMSQTEKLVSKETDIKEISKISLFNGFEQFHVVEGKTKDGKQEIAFVPKQKDAEITIVQKEKVLSRAAIQKQWQQECDSCKLVRITPAISKKQEPLWEVAYRDRTDRYMLDYYSMHDGKRNEQFGFMGLFE